MPVKIPLTATTLRTQLSKSGVAKVVDLVARTITHISDRFAEPDASTADVEAAWHHILALHQRQDALERALKAAEEAWYRDCTEEAETHLLDIKRQIAREASMDQMDAEIDQAANDSSDCEACRIGTQNLSGHGPCCAAAAQRLKI